VPAASHAHGLAASVIASGNCSVLCSLCAGVSRLTCLCVLLPHPPHPIPLGMHGVLHGQEQSRAQPHRRCRGSWAWGGAECYAAGMLRWATLLLHLDACWPGTLWVSHSTQHTIHTHTYARPVQHGVDVRLAMSTAGAQRCPCRGRYLSIPTWMLL
jgi:hypothetical protein